jgi:hypothetical protein
VTEEGLELAKAAEESGYSICPACGKEVENQKCRFCGARLTINDVSGEAIWMRNGRIVAGFKNLKQAYVQMAEQWGIPRDRWPKAFL